MQSVLTDCPDREKGPYTGDNLHNIDTELTLFDMQAYQGQMVNNMRTAQRPVPVQRPVPGPDRQHRARSTTSCRRRRPGPGSWTSPTGAAP